jgi:hypothetical protein
MTRPFEGQFGRVIGMTMPIVNNESVRAVGVYPTALNKCRDQRTWDTVPPYPRFDLVVGVLADVALRSEPPRKMPHRLQSA